MLDKLPIIQIDHSQAPKSELQLNGKPYSIVTKGLLVKHQCLLDAAKKVWLTIKKRGNKECRLVFANGNKYQMEVLTYHSIAFVFYDKEDTEIFRLTQPAFSSDAICVLVSEVHIPKEEFAALVAWGIYVFSRNDEKKSIYPAA